MLKYLFLTMLFGASVAQICPPAEDLLPCSCSETKKSIACADILGYFDIKTHFNNISTLFNDDVIFDRLELLSNSGLFEIPEGTIPNLKFLTIIIDNNGNLEHISPGAFNATYSVTKYLYVSNNYYLIHGWPYSERDLFDFFNDFTEIESIWAWNLALDVIPDNAFGPLPKLVELYLGSNYITKVGNFAFSQLSNLRKLWLGFNWLKAEGVAADAFQGVSGQLDIELDYNKIDHLPEQSFKPLLDQALKVYVGGSDCNQAGCSYQYLECDERADWICANQSVYEAKLGGFLCSGFDETLVWSYCANLTSSNLPTVL